jgi:hypothetical protein
MVALDRVMPWLVPPIMVPVVLGLLVEAAAVIQW